MPDFNASDPYAPFEAGVGALLQRLGADHPRALDVLTYQYRLAENLAVTRADGDTETRRADRAAIVRQLNALALETLNSSFNALCAPLAVPAGPTALPTAAGPYQSCFLSYSTSDEAFAQRLHARLTQAGVRVWFAPADIQGGEKLHAQLTRAIQTHDRLLLVLSEHSIASPWVETELRRALKLEREHTVRKLFPLRLVSYAQLQAWECFDADWGKDLAVEVREYFIPDFSNWADANTFETAFARLLADLKA